MKKLLIRILIGIVVLLVLVIIVLGLFMDSLIKKGIVTAGPMLTKVEIKLDSVNLSMLSGSGKIKGLVVGNPEGFKTPSAIQVGSAALALRPSSLLSDKIVIKSVDVQAPEITFEADLKANNLNKILANVQAATGGSGQTPPAKPSQPAPAPEAKPSKKLQVDDFYITGGKINVSLTVMGGKSVTVPLPTIHLSGLGQGPEGITAGELLKLVLQAIESEAAKASTTAVADLSKQAGELGKNLSNQAGSAAQKAADSVGGLFKKK